MDRGGPGLLRAAGRAGKELGIETYPSTGPLAAAKIFKGVYDQGSRKIIHFTSNGGFQAATATEVELGIPTWTA